MSGSDLIPNSLHFVEDLRTALQEISKDRCRTLYLFSGRFVFAFGNQSLSFSVMFLPFVNKVLIWPVPLFPFDGDPGFVALFPLFFVRGRLLAALF